MQITFLSVYTASVKHIANFKKLVVFVACHGSSIRPWYYIKLKLSFPGSSEVKVSACSSGDLGLIPRSGRSPGEGNGNPLQYSCLENPMHGRSLVGYSPWGHKESDSIWPVSSVGQSVVLITKSRTQLSDFTFTFSPSFHFHFHYIKY